MTNAKKLRIMCLITILLALMDCALTFINTPDLQLEGNPLVSVLGLGWPALFIANLIFFILYAAGGYFTLIKYQAPTYDVKNRREFVSQLLYNRTDKFVWILYKMPKNQKPLWASIAYAYLYTAPFARLILVVDWLLYTFDMDTALYNRLLNAMPFNRLDVSLGLVLAFYLIFHWISTEYRKNQENSQVKPLHCIQPPH